MKILVHYPFVPHYRKPVFKKFEFSEQDDFIFMSDWKGDSSGIKLISEDEFNATYKTSYIRWPLPFLESKLEFETGVLNVLLKEHGKVYIILGNINLISSWVYSIFARILGYRVIMWTHGLIRDERGVKLFLRKTYYSLADKLIVYGDRAKTLLFEKGIENVEVIYNSLDFEDQKRSLDFVESSSEIRRKCKIPDEAIAFITCSRLVKKFKLDQLIRNLDFVNRQTDRQLVLILVGDGELMDDLKRQASSCSLKVIFAGAIYDNKKLAEIFSISKACIVTGPVGLIAMNSMGFGVPIITHDNLDLHMPEIEAVLSFGYLYKEKCRTSFLECIQRVIASDSKVNKLRCMDIISSRYTAKNQLEIMQKILDEYR